MGRDEEGGKVGGVEGCQRRPKGQQMYKRQNPRAVAQAALSVTAWLRDPKISVPGAAVANTAGG